MNADNELKTTAAAIKKAFEKNLYHNIGKPFLAATPQDFYTALAYTVRSLLLDKYIHSIETYLKKDTRVVAYFSAEFLEGPHLVNNMLNLGVLEQTRTAMAELGLDLYKLAELEVEPGLGNRRPWTAGRLLPRFTGHPEDSGHRLWASLRTRHV